MKRSLLLFSLAVSIGCLIACGDENTTIVNEPSNMQVLVPGEMLPICSIENIGDIVYVSDSAKVYYCIDGLWEKLNGNDGKNGSVNTSVDTIVLSQIDSIFFNRQDSLRLIDTIKGIDGMGCYSEKIGRGHKVICGGDSVAFIADGADGLVGGNGDDGQGFCSSRDNGDGSLTISCGSDENAQTISLYKAICGKVVYDSDSKECIDLGLLNTCSESNLGLVEKNTNGAYYACDADGWRKSKGVEPVVGKICNAGNLGEMLLGSDANMWTCRENDWERSTMMEIAIGKSCTSRNQSESELLEYSYWICRADSVGWMYDFEHLNFGEFEYGGRKYKTVGIGSQMWMAENLNYADSVAMPNLKGNSACFYDDKTRCDSTGRLYSWTAAMNLPEEYQTKSATKDGLVNSEHQGICPDGWHIPTFKEYQVLHSFVDANNGSEGVGTSLKAPTGWFKLDSIPKGTDRFGFHGLPGDKWMTKCECFVKTDSTWYLDLWISPETDADSSTHMTTLVLSSSKTYSIKVNSDFWHNDLYHNKGNKMSVRCLKNVETEINK